MTGESLPAAADKMLQSGHCCQNVDCAANFWDPGDPSQEYFFDASVTGESCSHCNGVAVAAKTGGVPRI